MYFLRNPVRIQRLEGPMRMGVKMTAAESGNFQQEWNLFLLLSSPEGLLVRSGVQELPVQCPLKLSPALQVPAVLRLLAILPVLPV